MAATPSTPPTDHQPDAALRNADIVMKGGITSGVVYPGAIWALAQSFRFRSVGGSSAGAIAAAATAAAEHGRQSGAGEGFIGVQRLPEWLAADGGDRLFTFFHPQPGTKALFAVATAFVGARTGRPLRVAKAVIHAYPLPMLVGLIPALVLGAAAGAGDWTPIWKLTVSAALVAVVALVVAFWPASSDTKQDKSKQPASSMRSITALAISPLVILAALGVLAVANRHGTAGHIAMDLILVSLLVPIALVVPFVAATGTLGAQLVRTLPGNFFGLCTGHGPGGERGHPALTPWLAEYIDTLAGAPPDAAGRRRPLTFGDLDRYDITLQTTTTNLTSVRSYRLPLDDDNRDQWWFDPEEFRRLFPAYVVDWMTAPERHPESAETRTDGKARIPRRRDFPIVVAARMSLSFPFLLSAIPLYTRQAGSASRANEELTRCWFSDGGLVSNFPVHFFDSPLPRWPTFAVNLRGFPKGQEPSPNPRDNIYLVGSETGDVDEDWTEITSVMGFAGSLKSAMQNAHDNEQMRQIGYRDRIAHVRLASDEGGLNLKMPADRVQVLAKRGEAAGEALRRRFTAPPAEDLSWANHRWVRYRITIANLQRFLERFTQGYDYCAGSPVDGECAPNRPSYAELINRAKGTPPEKFFWGPHQQPIAAALTKTLIETTALWDKPHTDLDDGIMQPHSELRNVPKA